MRLGTLVRLCHHLSLALACTCLLQAERLYLPWAELAILPVTAIILLAFAIGGRWSIPNRLANLLALLIMAGGIWWMFLQIYDPTGLPILPLPTGLVPHVGPILMALLLVKLFRPQGDADFWVLQGIGLLQVALACVLATDPLFGGFLAAYLCSGLLTLALRHAQIYSAGAAEGSGPTEAIRRSADVPTSVGRFLPRLLGWMLFVGFAAGIFFLVTPRAGGPSWDPYARFGVSTAGVQALSGFSDAIDLNRTGELELDDEAAFTVAASYPDGEPKTDIGSGQRWRGVVLDRYRNGRWIAPDRFFYNERLAAAQRAARDPQASLPDLGRGHYLVEFNVRPRRAGGLFLAEPILFGEKGARFPVLPVPPSPTIPFFEFSGTLVPSILQTGRTYHYRQAVGRPSPDGHVPSFGVPTPYFRHLLAPPPPEIGQFSEKLLKQLAARRWHGLTPADVELRASLSGDEPALDPNSERVARALCTYLGQSGEFSYSLDLRRVDSDADPTLDFLQNVKEGHCELFASALAAMLRSRGIPARIIKGFRGAEHQGNGQYVIRQLGSHSWVEALVPRPVTPQCAAQIVGLAAVPDSPFLLTAGLPTLAELDWLPLDPTPSSEAQPPAGFWPWRWLVHMWKKKALLWQDMVLNFSADQQGDLWSALADSGSGWKGLVRVGGIGVALLLALWLTWRLRSRLRDRWLRRSRQTRQETAAPGWLTHLFEMLQRHVGVRPEPGQTPRETAAAASMVLAAHSSAGTLAHIPGHIVEIFYRLRYGRHVLTEAEQKSVDADLRQLEAALGA